MRRKAQIAGVLFLLFVVSASVGLSKKDEDQNVRSVQGTVTNDRGNPVQGAVVQIKNTKTLQIRSFITHQDGTYSFRGLSLDVDYELQAEYNGLSSPTKTLSSFDSRRKAVINLKLAKK